MDKNKTFSWDYLPVRAVAELIDDNNSVNNEIITEKLKILFDRMMIPENPLPEQLVTSGLITLNKNIKYSGY